MLSPLDRGLESREQLRRSLTRDDLAVAERGGAGHVVQMPVAEHNRELPDALILKHAPNLTGVLDRHMRVVDDRLSVRDHGVTGDPER